MIRFQSNKSMTSEEAASPLFFLASSSTNPRWRVAEILFCTSRTYFFKLKAFENNFERDDGQYHGLDFAYLVDLSTIDCHPRTLLSYL